MVTEESLKIRNAGNGWDLSPTVFPANQNEPVPTLYVVAKMFPYSGVS